MKDKIKNKINYGGVMALFYNKNISRIIIIFLLVCILIVGFLVLMKYVNFNKEFVVTLYSNGNQIEFESVSCTPQEGSCDVILPHIISSYEIKGWAINSDDLVPTYLEGETITLNKDIKLYAITSMTYTVTFDANGAKAIETKSLSCTSTNGRKCIVKLPTITMKTNGNVLGWNTNKDANVALYNMNDEIELKENISLYAIVENVYTATFDSTNLDYLASNTLSCTAYNSESCTITLPMFNRKGHYSNYWSIDVIASSDLTGKKWKKEYYYGVNSSFVLNDDITLYPNFNAYYYDRSESNTRKFRNYDTKMSYRLGDIIFDFEEGIPDSVIETFKNNLQQAYNNSKMHGLFTPCKVFVMTMETYDKYSAYYALTHGDYSLYNCVDVKYDSRKGREYISLDATLHELGHALDRYYSVTHGERISDKKEVSDLYEVIKEKYGINHSVTEFFADAVVDYYNNIVLNNNAKSPLSGDKADKLAKEDLESLKNVLEKYLI